MVSSKEEIFMSIVHPRHLRKPGASLVERDLAKDEQLQVVGGPSINGYLCLAVWDWGKARQQIGTTNARISTFAATLVVPPTPNVVSNQNIFIFQGLQPAANVTPHAILQPVLQWGQSAAGGGAFWSVSTCYVRGAPGALLVGAYTAPKKVNPGTSVTTLITLLKESVEDGQIIFKYACEFEGIEGTQLVIDSPDELVQAGIALEGYDLDSCAALPAGNHIAFSKINLMAGTAVLYPDWVVKSNPTCGLSASVISHNGAKDQIEVGYRAD